MEPKGAESAQRAKREYQRQWRKKRQLARNGAFVSIGFCPRCGMNLKVLATALAVVDKV